MKKILTVIGTRPEAIKLGPILTALNQSHHFENKICVTSQHTDLLDPFLAKLSIPADYHFESSGVNATLHQSAARILAQFEPILQDSKPDLVIVQGDTTSAFAASLASYYSCIPIAHVEAGLRTGHLYSPWPEEAHRCLIAKLATFCFAPTDQAKQSLMAEGVPQEKIWVVGNTSIDAIRLMRKPPQPLKSKERKIVVTVHRRENHGERLKEICLAIRNIVEEFPDIHIQFLLHPNPSVKKTAVELLSRINRIDLMEPLDHEAFIHLLDGCEFIITDSGGIQEEAPFIGKPVLIVRDTTERLEGILAGTAQLVGTNSTAIMSCCKELLENPEKLSEMSRVHYPYGEGYAANHIVRILYEKLCQRSI